MEKAQPLKYNGEAKLPNFTLPTRLRRDVASNCQEVVEQRVLRANELLQLTLSEFTVQLASPLRGFCCDRSRSSRVCPHPASLSQLPA